MLLFTAFLPESSVIYAYTAGLLTYSDIAPSQHLVSVAFRAISNKELTATGIVPVFHRIPF